MFNRKKRRIEKESKQQQLGNSLITFTNPKSLNAEQFRSLRTNIEFAQVDKQIKSLLVSSSIPAEGKSTVSSNLAYVMAQTEKRVLLVDADLRKPTVHRTFQLNNKQGLTTLLANPSLKFKEIVQYSREFNLFFLPSGPIPPNPSELLGSAKMKALMEELSNNFDIIIYDAPPVTAVADPQILATRVDGVLFIARYGYTRKEEIREAKKALENVNANVIGYVMNRQDTEETHGNYGYYGYTD